MIGEVSLVMPMAGRGSRFAEGYGGCPKPLISIGARPFFWWAVESVARAAPVRDLTFVVLDEHCRNYALDRHIQDYYPAATIVALPEVTAGAAETAWHGIRRIGRGRPVLVNDCDHAFLCPTLRALTLALAGNVEGGFLCFRSQNPAYSYVRIGVDGAITATVEKQVASAFAIAGCYVFSSSETFLAAYDDYRSSCLYPELFLSGIYNNMLSRGAEVAMTEIERHFPFGTPAELAELDVDALKAAFRDNHV